MITRCSHHRDRVTLPAACQTCRRIAIEVDIVTRTVDALFAAGYWLATDQGGEEMSVIRGTSSGNLTPEMRDLLLRDLMEVDDEQLYVWEKHSHADRPIGWVYFVYGNDGYDVISDYTTNLETVLAPINAYSDSLC